MTAENYCSFCHRAKDEINYLIGTEDHSVSICNICVERVRDTIGALRMKNEPINVTLGSQTGDPCS